MTFSIFSVLIFHNFSDFARSCGGEGYRVERPEELDNALFQAFASPDPAIVDVVIDKSKMAMPVLAATPCIVFP